MRENTAYIRPPRALWVPFDLGRPLGAPNEADFQRDVLRTVLALIDRTDGPVILEDYPHDAPGQGDPENMEGMVCPIPLRKPAETAGGSDLVQAVLDEAAQLAPWQALFNAEKRRSTVGVSTLQLTDCIHLLGDVLATGQSSRVPTENLGPAVRFASEDLRTYYLEAAAMRPGGAASQAALIDWFWGETSAGALVLALDPVCRASDKAELRLVGTSMLVPRAQQHRLKS